MEEKRMRAIVVADEPVAELLETLSKRNIEATSAPNADEALEECLRNPPHLAIVGQSLGLTTGVQFLAELLKISWTTGTILIADEDEESLHQQTEGLGILGAIRSVHDTKGLDILLNKFFEFVSINRELLSGGAHSHF
jgi:DNA-binding NarL/FixJ family response regulator